MSKFISILFLICLFSSCGSPRSSVRVVNKAEGVTTSISTSVGAGGQTTVTVSPQVSVDSTKIL